MVRMAALEAKVAALDAIEHGNKTMGTGDTVALPEPPSTVNIAI